MRLLVTAIAFLALAAPANAAEIVVTTRGDAIAADGQCSLREAIIAANTDTPGSGCPGGAPGGDPDVIRLAGGPYALGVAGAGEDNAATGDLDVRGGGPLTIAGNAATVDAASVDRVFDVVDPGASLTLRNVTVTQGLAPPHDVGGGILNAGTLALIDSTVTANRIDPSAAGFDGGLGGGIFSTGALTLTDSTVSDNRAGDAGPGVTGPGFVGGRGGGIYAAGPTTIVRSRLLRNAAGDGSRGDDEEDGGTGGAGGGLFVAGGGSATLTNVLLGANNAGHGGRGGDGTGPGGSGSGGTGGSGGGLSAGTAAVTVSFSTFADNGVGIGGDPGGGAGPPGLQGAPGDGKALVGSAQTTLGRSIVMGSCTGAPADGGLNLVAVGAACPGTEGDVPLNAAGAPPAGSPAIDGAPAAGCPATDLLGTPRPQGVRCDIGAIEARAGALTFSRTAFGFAALTAGLRSATLAVTVRNPGPAAYALPISVTGGPDFRLAAETCPAELARGRACAVTVAFAPSRAGGRAGTLRIAGRSFALTGTGLAPCVVPKLKRKTVKRARKALVRAHCTLGKVTRHGRGRPGRIRSSRPRAGSVLEAGAAVNVVVNRRRARPRR
ncbi:MAG TPA: choice-of-anchor D domain-containing protein [Solirubrobacteraceae bacterium]|nr:choice-of-anchor D domain-containing protein [Solirubrobacteraceae bacterium]